MADFLTNPAYAGTFALDLNRPGFVGRPIRWQGVRRGKNRRTTIPDGQAPRAAEIVKHADRRLALV